MITRDEINKEKTKILNKYLDISEINQMKKKIEEEVTTMINKLMDENKGDIEYE